MNKVWEKLWENYCEELLKRSTWKCANTGRWRLIPTRLFELFVWQCVQIECVFTQCAFSLASSYHSTYLNHAALILRICYECAYYTHSVSRNWSWMERILDLDALWVALFYKLCIICQDFHLSLVSVKRHIYEKYQTFLEDWLMGNGNE